MNKKNRVRFVIYFLFGCGGPVLMTLSIVLIDTYKVGKLLPDVGTYRCFLSLQVTVLTG
jgi:hypothetical protein